MTTHGSRSLRLATLSIAFVLLAWRPALAVETGDGDRPAEGRWAVSAGGGSLGLQGRLSYRLGARWALSGVVNGIDRDINIDSEEVNYDSTVDIQAWGIQLDWRPWWDYLRLSAGLFANDSRIEARARTPGNAISLGGISIPVDGGEAVTAEVQWHSAAPYLGIGFGNIFGRERRWALLADLGVIYAGEPDVEVSATSGSALNDLLFQSQVREEERRIRDDLERLRALPVVTLRFAYRF